MEAQEFFDREWPSMAPRLRRYLGALGVPAADRDDVLQEVALKLYRRWSLVDPTRPVEAYAKRIAANHWRDVVRARADRERIGDLPDLPDGVDVASHAEARIEFSRVAREIARLEPAQRSALLTEFATGSEPVSAAVRMARSRARRSLAVALRVASAVAALAATVGRRARSRPIVAVSSVAAAFALLGGASGLPVVPPAVLHLFGAHDHRATSAGPAAAAGAGGIAGNGGTNSGLGNAGGGANGAQPWVVDAGVARAEVLLRLQLLGYGVEVEQRGGPPVCVSGAPDDRRLRPVECTSTGGRPTL